MAASISDDEDGQLGPHSSSFSYEKWITNWFRDPTNCCKRDSGVAYRNLNVHAFSTTTDYQKIFANCPLLYLNLLGTFFGRQRKLRIDILRDFEGIITSGEMLLVLGRPGSGHTTFLKALARRTHRFFIEQESKINYQGKQQTSLVVTNYWWYHRMDIGIPPDVMHKQFEENAPIQQSPTFIFHIWLPLRHWVLQQKAEHRQMLLLNPVAKNMPRMSETWQLRPWVCLAQEIRSLGTISYGASAVE